MRDREDKLELRFLISRQKRSLNDEIKIKRRLREHFHRHFKKEEKAIKIIRLKGIGWFIIGAILMLIATFLFGLENQNFFYRLMIIIIEPAGWFMFWEGLNFVFITPNEKMPEFNFYRKMSKVEISFLDY